MREDRITAFWHSYRLGQQVEVARWGHWGTPVLLFPTAGGDAEECERFLMVKALGDLLDAGRIKLYACDSVAGRALFDEKLTAQQRCWAFNQFDSFVYNEVIPAIRNDCGEQGAEVIVAGASIGAFNALASICRHPDVFKTAICMSGTYDLTRWIGGPMTPDFYFSSPLHYLPGLGPSAQLEALRRRHVILATGQGRWEAPWESWQAANILGAKGVPNRVDLWGKDVDHDWVTWRAMLPDYLNRVA